MTALTDTLARPLRDLRISVTDRCNFRCTYCMPKEVFGHDFVFLRREQLLTFEEIERLARLFLAAGVTKIRLTGGEPLLRRDLETLVSMLSALRPHGLADLTLHPFFDMGAYRIRRGCRCSDCASWRPWPRKNGQICNCER